MTTATAPHDLRQTRVSRALWTLRTFARSQDQIPVLISLALVWIVFAVANNRFLTPGNLTNLALQIVSVGAISVGVVFVLLLGEIDLSAGALSGFAAAIMAVLNVNHGFSAPVAILAAVLGGAVVGTVQGLIITRFALPAFVVTLAGLLTWQGALLYLLGDSGTINLTDTTYLTLSSSFLPSWAGWLLAVVVVTTYGLTAAARRRSRGAVGLTIETTHAMGVRLVLVAVVIAVIVAVLNADRGVPVAVLVLVALVAIGDLVVRRSTFGRRVIAVGSNTEAARRAGINTNRVRIAVFSISGAMAGAGGVLAASRLLAVNQGSGGSDLLLMAIAGPVIAGTSLFGARGNVWSALSGAVLLGSISNGMDLLSLTSSVKYMITGLVLAAAVVFDSISRKRAAANPKLLATAHHRPPTRTNQEAS
ncbi:MAG: inner-rane translocator [Amycolatopsis sp.]|nr:inner-rane translocator [Amycolatopsis sp.]